MLDRVLAVSLRLVITTLIALAGGAAVLTGYSAFVQLVRVHWITGAWMLAVAITCGAVAYTLAYCRDDLADC
jgi:hypothetical protein